MDLRCLLAIKVITQHAEGAWALVAYCSGKRSVMVISASEDVFFLLETTAAQ